MGALVNGNFTQGDAVFNTFDNNRYFDTYLRVGGRLRLPRVPPVDAVRREAGDDGGQHGADDRRHEHGRHHPGERGHDAATTPTMRRFGIWRVGADAQFYFDIPDVGGLALKGEMVLSQDTNKDFRGVAADPCRDIKGFGWILTAQPEHRRLLRRRGAPRPVESQPRRRRRARSMTCTAGNDGRRQRQDHHPRHRPAAVHLGEPEGVGDLRARLARRRARARRAGHRPGERDRRATCFTLQLQARF